MAEKTIEQLQKELEAEKAKTASLTAEKEGLEASLKEAEGSGIVSPKVPGKATVTVEKPEGGKKKVTVGFRDGRVRTRLRNGETVSSAGLLKVANGQELSDEEKEHPILRDLTKAEAEAHLIYLVSVGASTIEERK